MFSFSHSSILYITICLSPLLFKFMIFVKKQALKMRLFFRRSMTSWGWQNRSCISLESLLELL